MVFWGGCFAVGPRGDLLAKGKYYKEELVEAELDFKDLDVARHFRPTLKNTRVEVIDEMRKSVHNALK
jgi:predicted amidohydrolase